jgi:hypothetical protein
MFTRRLQYSNNNNNNQGKEQAQQQESLKWRECAGKQPLAKWRHQNRDSFSLLIIIRCVPSYSITLSLLMKDRIRMIESVNVAEMSDACWSLRCRGLPSSNTSRTLRALHADRGMAYASINTSHFELVARWAHKMLHIISARHESMICIPLSYKGMLCFHSCIHWFIHSRQNLSFERNPENCHWMLRPSRQFSELAFLPRPSKQAHHANNSCFCDTLLLPSVSQKHWTTNDLTLSHKARSYSPATNSSNVSWHYYYVQSPSWANTNLLFTIKEEQH